MPSPFSCEDFDALLDSGDPFVQSALARQHAGACPRCRELVEALRVARVAALPASALAKAERAATLELKPVRPLSEPLMAAAGVVAALAILALIGIALMGSRGWAARLPWQRTASYLGAGSVLVLSLTAALRERVPGLSLMAPYRYMVAALAAVLWAIPFVLFEFRPEARFWSHGVLCGCAGLTVGTAAGAIIWLVVRRGYLSAPQRAGWFAGVAAGSLAFMVQETYCPVLDSAHAALWHAGVVSVLGAIGWIVGARMFRRD